MPGPLDSEWRLAATSDGKRGALAAAHLPKQVLSLPPFMEHEVFTSSRSNITPSARLLLNLNEWQGGGEAMLRMCYQGTKRRKVLLVEDDSAVNKVLGLSLRCGGFDTTQAESGGEALQKLDANGFDAVVLDLCLPDGLGGDVLHRLQAADSPVWVAMSALDEDEAHKRFGPLQGAFIAKPFDPWDLIGMLDRLLADDLEARRSARERRAAS